MKAMKSLLVRDIKNILNLRIILTLVVFILIQIFFDATGGFKDSDQTYEILLFPLYIIGSFLAVSLTFDTVSRDREGKIMDFILTSPISKDKIILSKLITMSLLMVVFSFVYMLLGGVIGKVFAGVFDLGELVKATLSMLVLLLLYGLWGVLCSIIFRKSKISLLVAVAITLVLRPPLVRIMLKTTLNLSNDLLSKLTMFLPENIMYSVTSTTSENLIDLKWGMAIMLVYIIVLPIIAIFLFKRQEELNYD